MKTIFIPQKGDRRILGLLPPKSKAIQIPSGWSDITLRDFVLLCSTTDYEDPKTAQFSLLTGLTFSEVEDLPINFVHKTIDDLGFLKKPYSGKPGPPKDVEFVVEGQTYVYYASYSVSPISRYILSEKHVLQRAQEIERLKTGDFSRLSVLVALLSAPKDKPLELLDYSELAYTFEKMKCTDAIDILIFFLRQSKIYEVGLACFFRRLKKRLQKKNGSITRNFHGARRSPILPAIIRWVSTKIGGKKY